MGVDEIGWRQLEMEGLAYGVGGVELSIVAILLLLSFTRVC
jgi:hypothetical protein